ncbi:hypothetical protein MRX96_050412 [Rhipicephalus microplus]
MSRLLERGSENSQDDENNTQRLLITNTKTYRRELQRSDLVSPLFGRVVCAHVLPLNSIRTYATSSAKKLKNPAAGSRFVTPPPPPTPFRGSHASAETCRRS